MQTYAWGECRTCHGLHIFVRLSGHDRARDATLASILWLQRERGGDKTETAVENVVGFLYCPS
ncbi:hypothetical protein DPMN_094771 [Dreissena polymorpha]|uniref:Uncharacterized protein n=1 Tax=Dreissena polymorpha TaxID=45954 RepID=A0A9D4R2Y6_DREPO|nr:hypothetical protein DPMN_094771 [Dreissena polymorpha]